MVCNNKALDPSFFWVQDSPSSLRCPVSHRDRPWIDQTKTQTQIPISKCGHSHTLTGRIIRLNQIKVSKKRFCSDKEWHLGNKIGLMAWNICCICCWLNLSFDWFEHSLTIKCTILFSRFRKATVCFNTVTIHFGACKWTFKYECWILGYILHSLDRLQNAH